MVRGVVCLFVMFVMFSCGFKGKGDFPFKYVLDSTVVSDPKIEALIEPYRARIDEEMGFIGNSKFVMATGRPEGLLSNFIADLLYGSVSRIVSDGGLEVLPVISIVNLGSVRSVIPNGAVTLANIFDVMPFDNRVLIFLFLFLGLGLEVV